MTKLTIAIDNYSLKELKEIYKVYYGYPKNEKVTKEDVAIWVGSFAQADIDSIETPEAN